MQDKKLLQTVVTGFGRSTDIQLSSGLSAASNSSQLTARWSWWEGQSGLTGGDTKPEHMKCRQHVSHPQQTQSTYCHEQHAVHGERRVARVKGQSRRERRETLIFSPTDQEYFLFHKTPYLPSVHSSLPLPSEIRRVGQGAVKES